MKETSKQAKTFDCLAYKWKVQEEIYEETKNMTPEQLIEYFGKEASGGPLGEWWKKCKKTH